MFPTSRSPFCNPPSLLAQGEQPLMLTMNCLNGYFVQPNQDALAEAFLKAEGRGTIAAFSPSGLSLDGPAHVFHRALVDEIFRAVREFSGSDAPADDQTVRAEILDHAIELALEMEVRVLEEHPSPPVLPPPGPDHCLWSAEGSPRSRTRSGGRR